MEGEIKVQTIPELCDFLERLISDMEPESKDKPWEWSFIAAASDEEHVEGHRESLRLTREHFNLEGPQEMGAVYVDGDKVIALTGTSPYSSARARYISVLGPQFVKGLVQILRSVSKQQEVIEEFAAMSEKQEVSNG